MQVGSGGPGDVQGHNRTGGHPDTRGTEGLGRAGGLRGWPGTGVTLALVPHRGTGLPQCHPHGPAPCPQGPQPVLDPTVPPSVSLEDSPSHLHTSHPHPRSTGPPGQRWAPLTPQIYGRDLPGFKGHQRHRLGPAPPVPPSPLPCPLPLFTAAPQSGPGGRRRRRRKAGGFANLRP